MAGVFDRLFGGAGEAPGRRLLEGYAAATQDIAELQIELDRAGNDLRVAGTHPWLAPEPAGTQRLCVWVASACAATGAALARAPAAPAGRGTPRDIELVAWATGCYQAAGEWSLRARYAFDRFGYAVDVPLPVSLPFTPRRVGTVAAVRGLAAAVTEVAGLVEAALADVAGFATRDELPREFRGAVAAIEQRVARARVDLDWAEPRLRAEVAGPQVQQLLLDALGGVFLAGQQAALPELIGPEYRLRRRPPGPGRLQPTRRLPPPRVLDPQVTGPGNPPSAAPARAAAPVTPPPARQDPPVALPSYAWDLTHPRVRRQRRDDPRAQTELAAFWAVDPDPQRTLRVQQQLDRARTRHRIRLRWADAGPSCPWAPVWLVRFPVGLGGLQWQPGDLVTYAVGVENGRFARRLVQVGRVHTRAELLGQR